MAITRAQQAKQMLQNEGRIGFKKGRDTGSDYGQFDRAVTRSQNNPSKTTRSDDGGNAFDYFSDVNISKDAPTTNIVTPSNINIGEINRIRNRRFLVEQPTFGMRVSDFIGGLPLVRLLKSLGEKGGKPFDAQGFGSGQSGGPQAMASAFIPAYIREGFNTQEEYEEYLASQKEDAAVDDKIERSLAFKADGGRIGLQEGGGIEQRLEKLGGDVSSAEQMLQGINQRLQTAESSLGSGGGLGGLRVPEGTIPTDTSAFKNIFQGNMSPPRPGAITPLLPDTGLANITVPPPPPGATFTPLPEDTNFQTGQAFQQARPGLLPNTRPMGLAAADGTMSLIPNPLSPQQQMEQANAAAEKSTPEERVQGAYMTLANRAKKSDKELAYLDRIIKSGGTDYLLDLDYFTNPGLRAGGGGSLGIPAASYADGGNVVGGEFDFESARQMYGLGKLVKKVTRTVKKIAKSPIGKAALLYVGAGGLGNLAAGKGFGSFFSGFTSPSTFLGRVPGIFTKSGLQNIGARIGFGGFENIGGERIFQKNILGKALTSPTGIVTATSLAAGLLTPEEEQQAQELADSSTDFDLEKARNSILAAKREQYMMDVRARGFKAEGGSAEDKEPVAKKTMPLLDMGGKEMDLREEGGFVPIGRMEKADDVPARLSKNEFVFTADAVRNAGDGDVDKGAEVMYNMMKNLEAGGEVSEESQGLEGARKMFQTSQRLEEVL